MLLGVSLAISASASSPPIACEISMENWCIVQLPSTIQLRDADKTREWTITTTADTSKARVHVSEDKFCDGEVRYRPNAAPRGFRFEARGGSIAG